MARLDLRDHVGAHPRFGVVDVVPFVPLAGTDLEDAVRARDEYARVGRDQLDLPCFLYGPERDLPTSAVEPSASWLRHRARRAPSHRRCGRGRRPVGARRVQPVVSTPRRRRLVTSHGRCEVPRCGRSGSAWRPACRCRATSSTPTAFGPAQAFDAVAAEARVTRAELVGLVPESVLQSVPAHRWTELDLDADRTIEARLAARP